MLLSGSAGIGIGVGVADTGDSVVLLKGTSVVETDSCWLLVSTSNWSKTNTSTPSWELTGGQEVRQFWKNEQKLQKLACEGT